MRISTAMGIVLCSGLAYTACGSDDGDKNPLAADVNNAETSDAGGDGNNTETPDPGQPPLPGMKYLVRTSPHFDHSQPLRA